MWDVVSAVNFIRQFVRQAHREGFNFTLGGGVLHNGFSNNDLDIVAIPRALDRFAAGFDIGKASRRLLEIICEAFHGTIHSERVIESGEFDRTVFHIELGTHAAPRIDLIIVGLGGLPAYDRESRWAELHNDDGVCNHVTSGAPGGGVKCVRKGCKAWYCA